MGAHGPAHARGTSPSPEGRPRRIHTDSPMSEHIYVYGVVEQQDLSLDIDGVDGADELYTVDYRTLSALVSDIDTTDPERSDENVETHNDVLQQVIEHDGGRTVVPMGFGMAFKNTRTLKGVMRGARRAFRKALNDIEGTVELGVKLVDTGDAVDHGAARTDVAERLGALAVEDTDDDLFSDALVLNRSYLVKRSERDAFDDEIDAIEADYPELTVQYTGPWAPYNFVDIQIGAE